MKPTFSPSEAAFSVFELAKFHPQFVLRFCIVNAVIVMTFYGICAAIGLGPAIIEMSAMNAGGREPDPEKVMALFEPILGQVMLTFLGLTIAGIFLSTMALRKLVHDDESGMFGLQIGRDEGRLLLANLTFMGTLFLVNFVLGLAGGLVGMANSALGALVISASIIVTAYVGLRLSQYGIAAVALHGSTLKHSWALTKGRAARFLGAYVLWVILSFIGLLIVQVIAGRIAGMMGAKVGGGFPASLDEFLSVGWLFYILISGLAGGVATLGNLCVGAYAWHQMKDHFSDARFISN